MMEYHRFIFLVVFFSCGRTIQAYDNWSRSYGSSTADKSSHSSFEDESIDEIINQYEHLTKNSLLDEEELQDYRSNYLLDNRRSFADNDGNDQQQDNNKVGDNTLLALSPADCNNDIELDDCTDIVLSSLINGAALTEEEEVVIPCGSCVRVDYTDGSTITLLGGLNIQGKLYFPSTSNVRIYTSHVFVMGILEMDPPEHPNTVEFRLFGSEIKLLHPIDNNEGACGDIGCQVGKKPFVVAGGQVKIHGLADPTCPSWVKLVDLKADSTNDDMLNRVVVGKTAASCWRIGDTLVLSSPHKDMNKTFQSLIVDINEELGEVIVESSIPPYFKFVTLQTAPDFAVEVTALDRSIVFSAFIDEDDEEDELIGGHFMIYHTPGIVQIIEGIEVTNFGQQGNLGRYPIHFHMCGDVSGSIVSKNVVHHSNQRGFVVHGSHNIHYKDNVAYEIFGHCFMIEDGIETGNLYEHNLAMVIRKPKNVIPGENDDEPSAFWISNPQNRFIENVAASSENNGFWFDLRFNVRGPSYISIPGANHIQPIFKDVTEFRGNTAHGNRVFGMRYYTRGWRPRGGENILRDCRVYRNRIGQFLHSDTNIAFVDGIIADNDLGVKFFQNSNIRFDNITLKGHTDEYDAVYQQIPDNRPNDNCRSVVGMEIYVFPILDDGGISSNITNLKVSNFDSSCATTFKMSPTQIYERKIYTSRDQINNIVFEDEASKKINLCDAMSHGATSIAIHDLDGSLDPNESKMSGFIVSDEAKMTTFLGNACTKLGDLSCAQYCQGTCLRNIRVITSAKFPMRNMEMVVSDGGQELVVPWTRYEQEDMHKNTHINQEAHLGVALPAADSYHVYFRDEITKKVTWPDFAFLNLEDPPLACTDYIGEDSVLLMMPPFDAARCSGELLVDGNFENIATPNQMGGWMQHNLDLELVNQQPGSIYPSYTLKTSRREQTNVAYISQYIDRSCLVGKAVLLKFSADIRVEEEDFKNTTSHTTTFCRGNSCPKAKLEFIDGALMTRFTYFDKPSKVSVIGTISDTTKPTTTDGWYKMEGSLLINDEEDLPEIALLKVYLPSSNKNNFIIDNVSLTLIEAPSKSPVNLAFNKPTEQKGTLHDGVSSLAVDGNIGKSSYIHTRINGWWEVDLEATASIDHIKIYNSKTPWHLDNTYIAVLDDNRENVGGYFTKQNTADVIKVDFSNNNIEGRYVRISVEGYLKLCEVEIYGTIQDDVPISIPDYPTIDAPITPNPSTDVPISPNPTIASLINPPPTTTVPITLSPTTTAPQTPNPITVAPTNPITAAPISSAPFTPNPTIASTSTPVTTTPTYTPPITLNPTTRTPSDHPTLTDETSNLVDHILAALNLTTTDTNEPNKN